jgi:hypothetical protein
MAGATMPPEALNPDFEAEPEKNNVGFIKNLVAGLFG